MFSKSALWRILEFQYGHKVIKKKNSHKFFDIAPFKKNPGV